MIRDEGALHTHFVPVRWPGPSPTIGFCAHISAQRDSLALSSAISIIAISSHISVLTSKQPHLVLFTCSACQLGIMMFSRVEMSSRITWHRCSPGKQRQTDYFVIRSHLKYRQRHVTRWERRNKWFLEMLISLTRPHFGESNGFL